MFGQGGWILTLKETKDISTDISTDTKLSSFVNSANCWSSIVLQLHCFFLNGGCRVQGVTKNKVNLTKQIAELYNHKVCNELLTA